ncbi:MAG: ATP-dependent DNA helicase RecG [Fimbriimonadaceae bacterium]
MSSSKPPLTLETPVQFVPGVGEKVAKLLAKLDIQTAGDLLELYPRRYEDRTNLPPISKVQSGETVTVRGRLSGIRTTQTRNYKRIVQAEITDGTGTMVLKWWNQPWVADQLRKVSGEVFVYGTAKLSDWHLEIASPDWEPVPESGSESFARIVPVYPLTEGINQKQMRRIVTSVLPALLPLVEDLLPESVRKDHKLLEKRAALKLIHEPGDLRQLRAARQRLVFDEFFGVQLGLAFRRASIQQLKGLAIPTNSMAAELEKMFPFELTEAQTRVIHEIWEDMERPIPMNRLVQGDVGSGKTAVAAAAILAAVKAGYQAALMAPTEILAEQHFRNLSAYLEPFGFRTTLFLGKHTQKQRASHIKAISSGFSEVAIGTHALLSEGVEFKNLALVVVDEQHRFGVKQRVALRQKAEENPHMLVMTATPIPRTLTMAYFGDLDVSKIDQMPKGRMPIRTHVKPQSDRASVYQGVRKLLEQGRQAYFVCPMVEESPKIDARVATELHATLSQSVFPDYKVGLLHGQMKPKEKDGIMEQFRNHELDVLVSTTVIEVGVDVPNSTVMVIEDANRFGLSQLHQLRGRVGRGEHQGFCVLLAPSDSADSIERLNVLASTTDGFKIADEDLRLRGPGEIAGTAQSGQIQFKIADLVNDGDVLDLARNAARKLVDHRAKLSKADREKLDRLAKAGMTELGLIISS